MSDERFATAEDRRKVMAITPEAFVDFLNLKGPKSRCVYCAIGDYGVSPGPDDKAAVIVATPLPNYPASGILYFPATCINCGFTAFFNAAVVVAAMKGDD